MGWFFVGYAFFAVCMAMAFYEPGEKDLSGSILAGLWWPVVLVVDVFNIIVHWEPRNKSREEEER